MSSPYTIVGDIHKNSFAGFSGFSELLLANPLTFEPSEYEARSARHQHLLGFFQRTLDIFRRAVSNSDQARICQILLNDSMERLPLAFYKSLPNAAWHVPRFFRTDESRGGKIFEIQCPGSGWGNLVFLGQLHCADIAYDPARTVARDIQKICDQESPSVLHLLDNASDPASMRLLISSTQPPLRYWGYFQGVIHRLCDFVRSHSVYGLIAENLFVERLKRCADDKCFFDLPPLMIFDQKMLFALPFLDETKDAFTDLDRTLFAYTYPISARGFRDQTGEWTSIDSFLKRSPKNRRYFLKYAGCDTNCNWGSRAVYRLDKNSARDLLTSAVADSENGRPWVLQPDVAEKEEVTYLARDEDRALSSMLTCKYSCFYAPSGLVGIRSMHRNATKVHGQTDTVIGLVRPV